MSPQSAESEPPASSAAGGPTAALAFVKRRLRRADGRYIIYYEFLDASQKRESDAEGPGGAAQRPDHV